jgi:Fe-S-cluster containining protein
MLMATFWEEHRDDSLCADCGGKCCYVYGPPYNMTRERLHEDKRGIHGGGYYANYGVQPLPQKIHPHACEYLSPSGCIIPWEKRPPICKNYRCGLWRDLVFRR